MITKADIQKAVEIHDKAYKIADFISKKYVSKAAGVSKIEVREDWTYISGDDYWAYGGHDTFVLQFPSELLMQDDWQIEADKIIQNWIESDNRKRQEKELREQRNEKEQERKQYEKLKQKFEANDQREG